MDVLEVLARLDVVEPATAIAHAMGGEVGRRIRVPRSCGWSGYEVERLLRRYWIPIWARAVSQEHISFRVKRRQAAWAAYLLRRRGIPVAGEPLYPYDVEPGPMPPSQSRPTDRPWIDRVIDLLRPDAVGEEAAGLARTARGSRPRARRQARQRGSSALEGLRRLLWD